MTKIKKEKLEYSPDDEKARMYIKEIDDRTKPFTPEERIRIAAEIGDMCLERVRLNVYLGNNKGNLVGLDMVEKSARIMKSYLDMRDVMEPDTVEKGVVQRIELVIPAFAKKKEKE